MKRIQVIIAAGILAVLSLSSCIFLGPSVKGDGNVIKETREISGFCKVEGSTGLEIHLVSDSFECVVVEADENLHQVIKTEREQDVLKIYTRISIRRANSKKVFVHYTTLSGVKSSSGAAIRSQDTIVAKSLDLRASSGSQQYLGIHAENFEAQCSSGAQIYLNGKADRGTIKASSGAHLKGNEFVVKDCVADVSSGAHIWVEAVDAFDGEASSGGHIYYAGNPGKTTIKKSSGGAIIRKQD